MSKTGCTNFDQDKYEEKENKLKIIINEQNKTRYSTFIN